MPEHGMSEHRPEGLIKIANTLLERQMNELISDIFPELTGPQFVIVYYLHEHRDQDIRQKDVADRFYLSHPTVRGMVKRLTESGWLAGSSKANDDRRQVLLNLTDKAVQCLDREEGRILQALDTTTGMATKGFSHQDQKTLVSLLRRIITNMSRTNR